MYKFTWRREVLWSCITQVKNWRIKGYRISQSQSPTTHIDRLYEEVKVCNQGSSIEVNR